MSNIDYTQICPEFYTNYEDGCCMENCIYNDLDECPIHYVKGLLDEKDKAIENWQTMYESVMQTCGNDAKEIERLNKQLADTEFRYENLHNLYCKETEELKQQLAEKEKENELMAKTLRMTKFIEKEISQDKISFAVEQLEKVKEIMSKSNESGYIIRFASMNDRDKFNETINNQIKQLKEQKNEKIRPYRK